MLTANVSVNEQARGWCYFRGLVAMCEASDIVRGEFQSVDECYLRGLYLPFSYAILTQYNIINLVKHTKTYR